MLDYAIIIAYLLLTLVIGYFSGKNVHTVQDYSVANRNFSNMTLLATIFASFLGGADIFGTAEKTYRYGTIFLLAISGYSVNLLIISKWMTKRIVAFKNAMTLGDIMYALYGKTGRILAGLALFACVGVVGAQVAVIGNVCNMFLGLDAKTGIVIGCAVIMLYSGFGGIKAVTFTDLLQFIILIVAIPVVISIMLGKAGGFEHLFAAVPESLLYVSKTTQSYWDFFMLFLVIALPVFDPPFIQRILMSKNVAQATNMLFTAACLYIPFILMIGIAGFSALVVLPNINPDMAFSNMINFALPGGLKGLAVAGILAVVMSTADSYLNVIGISFARDIVKTIYSKQISDRAELRLIRISTICFGALSMFAATSFSSIMDILLFTNNFYIPFICAPMFFGVTGHRVSVRSCLIGVISGCALTAYWLTCVHDETLVGGIIPSLLLSLATTYISDKIEKFFRYKRVEEYENSCDSETVEIAKNI
ncbi:MAG: sodium:solute symporter family protein [Alphaproteobacteria bacterium]|nr:sodium:solute symporter family protein [Alphaproteobacteria bacterium]